MTLSAAQEEIINATGNLVVSASAGTGKTHTLVSKIVHDLEVKKTFQSIAAITFTAKAAKEIKERLTINVRNNFIGTNNSFVVDEIIRPFFKDVYGTEYDYDFDTNYSKKFISFEDGIKIAKEDKLLGAYHDKKQNFIFDLALEILKKSEACKWYIEAKYFKIYIDEYQDCDTSMHKFFMHLCDELHIETFVVGDEKQSIYIWRGGDPKLFQSIFSKNNFKTFVMKENFRSCQQIQNYSCLLFDKTSDRYKRIDPLENIIWIDTIDDKWIEQIEQYIDDYTKTALLRRKNEDAKGNSKDLTEAGFMFTYIPRLPISEITTNSSWLYMSIARYILLSSYSVYDFLNEIPNAPIFDEKIIDCVSEMLDNIDNMKLDVGFSQYVKKIFEFLGYEYIEDHIGKLQETVSTNEYIPAFDMDKYLRVSLTVHAAKGLEFDQIIVFAEDFDLTKREEILTHYVAITRAKSRAIIVKRNCGKANQFELELTKILERKGLKIEDIVSRQ